MKSLSKAILIILVFTLVNTVHSLSVSSNGLNNSHNSDHNGARYEIPNNPPKTLLSDRLKLKKYKNVKVLANKYTSLYGSIPTNRDNYISVDLNGDGAISQNEILKDNVFNAQQYLGYAVDVYVNEEDEIKHIHPVSDKNNIIIINADNIQNIGNNLSLTDNDDKATIELVYKDGHDKEQQLDISSEACLIYNGKRINLWIDDNDNDGIEDNLNKKIKPISGRITLLDNDDNGEYDVIFVSEHVNYVVDEVNIAKNRISFKSGYNLSYGAEHLILDKDDSDYEFRLILGGKSITVAQLEEWDVLSVIANYDGDNLSDPKNDLFIIHVTREEIKGKVTEDSGIKKYIYGKEYELANNLVIDEARLNIDYNEDGDKTDIIYDAVKLGDDKTFYLDIDEKIAAYDLGATDEEYAVILGIGKNAGLNAVYQVKLLNDKGRRIILTMNDKLEFNGEIKKPSEAVDSMYADETIDFAGENRWDINDINRCIVKYRLDDKGNIKKLSFPNEDAQQQKRKFSEHDLTLGNEFFVLEETVVFDVSKKKFGKPDIDNFSITRSKDFVDGYDYWVSGYEIKNSAAKVVLMIESGAKEHIGTDVAIINRITSFIRNGDRVYKLQVFSGGKETYLYAENKSIFSQNKNQNDEHVELSALTTGNVISYKLNADGEIDSFNLLFTYDKNLAMDSAGRGCFTNDDELKIVYAQVVEKGSMFIKARGKAFEKGDEYTFMNMIFSLKDAQVYEYEVARNKINYVGKDIIGSGDYVYIRLYKDKVQDIMVIGDGSE